MKEGAKGRPILDEHKRWAGWIVNQMTEPEPNADSVACLLTTSPGGNSRSLKVALVCMPFASVAIPSIQIGLLTALTEEAGFDVDAHHLNLDLAATLGPDRYEQLCGHRGHMTGEWLFSVAAFGLSTTTDDEAYARAFPDELQWAHEELGMELAGLSSLRHDILPRYVDDCLNATDWSAYHVVGFTSTFQQNVASLALARRIKERWPHVVVVLGGANMEDVMGPEYVRAFPFVDYGVVGEGDVVFPELLRALAAGEEPRAPGIARRCENGVVVGGQASGVRDLDRLPVPNYDEFYRRANDLGLQPTSKLPFESSRGCWWGQKSQCTFCGLNGLGMAYRAKTADRLFFELEELGRRYGVRAFDATDNILLPKYVTDVFEKIAESKTDFEFFYEVKSNLGRAHLRSMYRGGVRRIQPGIESMSTHILELMKKGGTMLRNVRLLKWSRYYGIRVNWNLLCGFPGETTEDYRRQLEVLTTLSHLEPPSGLSRIWLERFSPYFVDRNSYPIHDVRPEASYAFVYPEHVALDKVAYFFDYSMSDTVADEELYSTEEWVTEWRRRWSSGSPADALTYARTHDAVFIQDGRGRERPIEYVFDGPLGIAYESCNETARSVGEVVTILRDATGCQDYSETEVRGTLDEFCGVGLMLAEKDQYLSLALPINRNW